MHGHTSALRSTSTPAAPIGGVREPQLSALQHCVLKPLNDYRSVGRLVASHWGFNLRFSSFGINE